MKSDPKPCMLKARKRSLQFPWEPLSVCGIVNQSQQTIFERTVGTSMTPIMKDVDTKDDMSSYSSWRWTRMDIQSPSSNMPVASPPLNTRVT